MKKRVLLINEFASLNGGERSMLANLERQRDEFDFVAVVPPGDLAVQLRLLGIDTIDTSSFDEEDLLPIVRRCNPDLIHANSLNISRRIARFATITSAAMLGHCRDIYKLSRKAISDLNRLTKMIFVSQAAFDFHVGQGFNANTGIVIHNGVDLAQFQPRPATGFLHRELDLDDDAKIVLSIGQIGMRKGLKSLLTAFEQVCHEQADARLVIVGQRYSQKDEAIEYEQALRMHARSVPLRSRIHFVGVRDDIALIMNEAAMLVHAARQEPLGRVLLEACASGLPVVATDVGGTREIFPTPNSGAIVVDVDDCAVMSRSVQRVLTDDELADRMSLSARARAVSAFDREMSARKISEIYRNLNSRE